MSVPVTVVAIREAICAACTTPCPAYQSGSIDHAASCSTCPLHTPRWHPWDCADDCCIAPAPAPNLSPEPALPSLPQRAINLGRQVASEVAARIRRKPATPASEAARRMDICRANRCGLYRSSDGACAACGCPLVAKTPWRSATCPRGLW